MTRYILKPTVSMYDCKFCSKEFKNGSSLASHKYRYHNDHTSISNRQHSSDKEFHDRSNLKHSFGVGSDGSDYEIQPTKSRKVDKQNSRSTSRMVKSKYQRNESSYEGSSNESSDETEEMFGKHTPTRNKEDVMNSIKPMQRSKPIIHGYKSTKYEIDDSEESEQESTLDDVYHRKSRHRENRSGRKISSKNFTPNKCEINKIYSHSQPNRDLKQHIKLIKTICKCILDGRIPLEPPHIAKLKQHREVIRNVAYDNLNVAKEHIQTGGSILQTVFETVLPILPELLL